MARCMCTYYIANIGKRPASAKHTYVLHICSLCLRGSVVQILVFILVQFGIEFGILTLQVHLRQVPKVIESMPNVSSSTHIPLENQEKEVPAEGGFNAVLEALEADVSTSTFRCPDCPGVKGQDGAQCTVYW